MCDLKLHKMATQVYLLYPSHIHSLRSPLRALTVTSQALLSRRPLAVALYKTVNWPTASSSWSVTFSRGNSHFGSMPMAEVIGLSGEGGRSHWESRAKAVVYVFMTGGTWGWPGIFSSSFHCWWEQFLFLQNKTYWWWTVMINYSSHNYVVVYCCCCCWPRAVLPADIVLAAAVNSDNSYQYEAEN